MRDAALKAAAKFDQKAWRKLERALQSRARRVPPESLAAECLAIERLDAARELHAAALRTEKRKPWHALRIGVKRFRYTVESLLPARYEMWGDNLKRLQDLLGDAHDLDVLADAIHQVASGEPEESRTGWKERLVSERHVRIETYRQLTLGKTSLWHEWRQGLANGGNARGGGPRALASDRAGDGWKSSAYGAGGASFDAIVRFVCPGPRRRSVRKPGPAQSDAGQRRDCTGLALCSMLRRQRRQRGSSFERYE